MLQANPAQTGFGQSFWERRAVNSLSQLPKFLQRLDLTLHKYMHGMSCSYTSACVARPQRTCNIYKTTLQTGLASNQIDPYASYSKDFQPRPAIQIAAGLVQNDIILSFQMLFIPYRFRVLALPLQHVKIF